MAKNAKICHCAGQNFCSCANAVVCIRNLSFAYNVEAVLEEINLCVPRGIFIGIIGPNGGGKSTLLRLLLGLLPLKTGQIELFGLPIQNLGNKRRLIGYVPQNPQIEPSFPATALEVVLMGSASKLGLFRQIDRQTKNTAYRLLEQVDMADSAHRPFAKLSSGQQQRVLIARALVSQPQLLVLDEPLASIDVQGQKDFFDSLRRLKDKFQLTLIMVSHDVGHLVHFADQIACLYHRIHWHDYSELITEEVLERVYACELDSYLSEHRRHIEKYHPR